jgi:hypothetical protein
VSLFLKMFMDNGKRYVSSARKKGLKRQNQFFRPKVSPAYIESSQFLLRLPAKQ